MRKYVTNDVLSVVKKDEVYPKDVPIRDNQFIHFNKIGMTVYRLTNKGETFKHINYWQTMSVEEINERLNAMEWRKE